MKDMEFKPHKENPRVGSSGQKQRILKVFYNYDPCRCTNRSGFTTVDGVDIDDSLVASIQSDVCNDCGKIVRGSRLMENQY